MPEIRATLPEALHRQLKAEAAENGKHLKELIAEVLAAHAEGNSKKQVKK